MNWNSLTQEAQLQAIDEESANQPVFIFKHSTRCSISAMALNRLESKWQPGDEATIKPYYLDLLNYRPISAAIAQRYGVEHESPQVLVIQNGKCTFSASHNSIRYDDLVKK